MLTWRLIAVVIGGVACGGVQAATITVEGTDSGAIKAAIAQAQPGDTVLLPEGTYRITEGIVPTSGIKLAGAGQDRTVIECAADKPITMVSISGCEDVEVCDLTLDGLSSKNAHGGVAAGNSRRLSIHDLTVRNLVESGFGPHGIRFSGADPTRERGVTDSTIADCTLENIGVDKAFGCGIRLSWGSSRNRVTGCRVDRTGRGGIFGDNGSCDLVIRDNVVTNSGGEKLGIEVWGGCDRCVIEDNTVDHWLSIGGCDRCAVRRNTISATDGSFGFIGIEAIGSYLIVTNNVVDDGQVIGLSLSGPDPKRYHYYADNAFRRCSQWGAQLQGEKGGCGFLYFLRCKFNDTTVGRGRVWYAGDDGNGFRVNGNTQDMVLEECEMAGNGRHGIQVTVAGADRWSFQRCTVAANKGRAYAGPAATEALEWVDCKLEDNGGNEVQAQKAFATEAPQAGFDAPEEVRAGQEVAFEGKPVAPQGVAACLWDFGDGIPVVGEKVTHRYDRPGKYAVTLLVWDKAGRAGRATREIVVVP